MHHDARKADITRDITSKYTTSPDDDKLQKSKSIDGCLKYFFRKQLYVKKQFENFSGTAVEFHTLETQNFQHWLL